MPSAADEIVGRASVIDGDTIDIHGQRVRLYGIDATEAGQTCSKADDASRPCRQKDDERTARLAKRHI